ncbi:Substrate-specific component CbrT of predicted cobalamin ECF transporter [Alkalibacterium sp. AK22]|uniref:ECF transporter S component n=1 Tax=Alkalibacterium sp. AK22 TaxID=1229520 RepID=UPI00044AFBEF|nr:ECF transporter S component [Alkalibacterium sp. AK22]EXJ23497.1 Substrate-specific component CbrT of predicted cobalamin ECF transporter [Alkalibacterium sp. AK22]
MSADYSGGQSHDSLSPASRLTRTALLTALVSVSRLSFSFLPNIQPMTVLLMSITLYYGWRVGLTVAWLSVVITNIYLGMGPWTFAQIGAYAGLIFLSSLLKKSHEQLSIPALQVYVAFMGILYGLLLSLLQAPFFGWNIFIPYYLSGLGYDLLHALGNMLFFPLIYPLSLRLFKQTDTHRSEKRNDE